MSMSTGTLSISDYKLLKRIVEQTRRLPGETDTEIIDRVTALCVTALSADLTKTALIKADVTELSAFYHRPTLNDFFRSLETQAPAKKRSEDAQGFPRKKQKPLEREIMLDNSLLPSAKPDVLWNPLTLTAPTHTQYSGDLTIRFIPRETPVPDTITTWPSVAWDITGMTLPLNGVKTTGRQVLDPKRLQTWDRSERRTYDGQNTVMGNKSALQAAAAGGIIPLEFDKVPATNYGNSAWEWLHLVSFKMGGIGNVPQQPGNLVAGTYECNSLMISIEEAIKDLVLIDKLTLTVEVTAQCVNGTHIGKSIDYRVHYQPADATKPELSFTQHFDPLVHINPSSGDKAIFKMSLRTKFGLPT